MLKHIEFVKNEIDTHPQTGETKNTIIIDAYYYQDHFILWGWGTYNKYNYDNKSLDEVVKISTEQMLKDGYKIASENGIPA